MNAWWISARSPIPTTMSSMPCLFDDIASAVSITGAQFTSADLIAGLRSFRDVAALVRVWEMHGTDEPRAVVWCSGSVPQVLADLEVLGELADVAGTSLPSATLRARLTPVLAAVRSGDIEWLFATPAQPDAVQQASLDVAAAVGIGATVRGVLVAPMPRKKDGWPKEIRESGARDLRPGRDGSAPDHYFAYPLRRSTCLPRGLHGCRPGQHHRGCRR